VSILYNKFILNEKDSVLYKKISDGYITLSFVDLSILIMKLATSVICLLYEYIVINYVVLAIGILSK
jgi:hypothetical protein